MDELDLFRDFRRVVAAPSDDARRPRPTRLAGAGDAEGSPIRALVRMRKRSHYGALAVFALAGATAAALFLSAPVSSPPTFLERAEAAPAPPGDTVLHYKWMETSSVTNPACSVTRGPNEIWIDLAPPHRYRAILDDPPAGAIRTSSHARAERCARSAARSILRVRRRSRPTAPRWTRSSSSPRTCCASRPCSSCSRRTR